MQGGQQIQKKFAISREFQGRVRPNDDDPIVSGGQVEALEAQRLAQKPFDAISTNGGADAAGDTQAQAGIRSVVWKCVDGKRAGGLFDSLGVDGVESEPAAQTIGFGKFIAGSLHGAIG
jgi:hypothetical protein